MEITTLNENGQKASLHLADVELVLPDGMFAEICEYLFRDSTKEYACYLLCGHRRKRSKLTLLACSAVFPEADEYEAHSLTSVRVKRSLLIGVLKECERLGLSLVDIHSHPFSTDSVSFSSVDEADESEKGAWFAEHLPKCYYGSVVMAHRCHKARIRAGDGSTIELPLRVRQLKCPMELKDETPSVGMRQEQADSARIRQVQAFGHEGQKRIAQARIGIVGLGGLGSGLAINLARLGVRNFTLIDHDRVEIHNLNRLAGMTRADARFLPAKVDIAAREIWNIEPKAIIRRIVADVRQTVSWRKLLEMDMVVVATDNHGSRMFVNILSQQYLLPQVSVGALIGSKEGEITDACGHVAVVLPGKKRPCLLCANLINPVEAYYETASLASRQRAVQEGYIKNFDESAPSVVHLNGVLTNLAIVEIHNLLHGFKEPAPYLLYDMLEQQIYSVTISNDQCAVCGASGGYFGRGDLVPMKDVFANISQL